MQDLLQKNAKNDVINAIQPIIFRFLCNVHEINFLQNCILFVIFVKNGLRVCQ